MKTKRTPHYYTGEKIRHLFWLVLALSVGKVIIEILHKLNI